MLPLLNILMPMIRHAMVILLFQKEMWMPMDISAAKRHIDFHDFFTIWEDVKRSDCQCKAGCP